MLRYHFPRGQMGNVRVLFADLDQDGKIEGDDPNTPSNESELMQINSYYPFGMLHEGGWNGTSNTTALEYGYGGKELNQDLGLNWMDFGGRWYMSDLGRWNAVDPLAEQGYSRTPYHYVRNNPLAFIDPTGFGEKGAVRSDIAASSTSAYDEVKKAQKEATEREKNKNNILLQRNVSVESGDVVEIEHGRNGILTTQEPGEVRNFVNEINDIPNLNKNKKATITIILTVPYKDYETFFFSSSQLNAIQTLKRKHSSLPKELKEGFFKFLDSTTRIKEIPEVELEGIVQGYLYTLQLLQEADIEVDFNINTQFKAVSSRCKFNKYPCTTDEHPPNRPSTINLRFDGEVHVP